MSEYLQGIPPALRVEDTCDYCRRQFAWARGGKAICPSCGLENVRREMQRRPESAMLAPAAERAVLPAPKVRRSPRRKK